MMKKAFKTLGLLTVAALALAACSPEGSSNDGSNAAPKDSPTTLRILAGSEVKDMEPIFNEVEKSTGVDIQVDYTGTLDGAQLVAAGGAKGKYDATLFPSNRYLSLLNTGRTVIKNEQKIMNSPVVLGVKHQTAVSLGWNSKVPTWNEIVDAVNNGQLKYAMTSPVSSNSGFSTLIEAATALSGTGNALQSDDVNNVSPSLKKLFAGQKLTAGSSGFLVDKFNANSDAVNAMFNYESVLKTVKVDNEPLDIIVPSNGVISADYPLSLLNSAVIEKEALYNKVSTALMTPAVQTEIAQKTFRRTTTTSVGDATVFELPFPNQLSTVQTLIGTYLSQIKKPSDMVFATDTSGSMDGDRLTALKGALSSLTDTASDANSFTTFQPRETIDYVEFSDEIKSNKAFSVSETDRAKSLKDIQDYINSLSADGGTAIYDAMEESYRSALSLKKKNPDHFISVTLFTDGENANGSSLDDFKKFYASQVKSDTGIQTIPTYVIVFGEANSGELNDLAKLTGGKTFSASDATKLQSAFKEIRGYQ